MFPLILLIGSVVIYSIIGGIVYGFVYADPLARKDDALMVGTFWIAFLIIIIIQFLLRGPVKLGKRINKFMEEREKKGE